MIILTEKKGGPSPWYWVHLGAQGGGTAEAEGGEDAQS
jgi:hypothetical protein